MLFRSTPALAQSHNEESLTYLCYLVFVGNVVLLGYRRSPVEVIQSLVVL